MYNMAENSDIEIYLEYIIHNTYFIYIKSRSFLGTTDNGAGIKYIYVEIIRIYFFNR